MYFLKTPIRNHKCVHINNLIHRHNTFHCLQNFSMYCRIPCRQNPNIFQWLIYFIKRRNLRIDRCLIIIHNQRFFASILLSPLKLLIQHRILNLFLSEGSKFDKIRVSSHLYKNVSNTDY